MTKTVQLLAAVMVPSSTLNGKKSTTEEVQHRRLSLMIWGKRASLQSNIRQKEEDGVRGGQRYSGGHMFGVHIPITIVTRK